MAQLRMHCWWHLSPGSKNADSQELTWLNKVCPETVPDMCAGGSSHKGDGYSLVPLLAHHCCRTSRSSVLSCFSCSPCSFESVGTFTSPPCSYYELFAPMSHSVWTFFLLSFIWQVARNRKLNDRACDCIRKFRRKKKLVVLGEKAVTGTQGSTTPWEEHSSTQTIWFHEPGMLI